jgi:hypothetical protein
VEKAQEAEATRFIQVETGEIPSALRILRIFLPFAFTSFDTVCSLKFPHEFLDI